MALRYTTLCYNNVVFPSLGLMMACF